MQHESARRRTCTRDPPRDETLQHPRCVYQILKRHFARYTPEMVERVCGVPQEQFLEVCRGVDRRTPAASAPPRWSTRSAGPSTASACSTSAPAAILQLLLGNIGRPGGGIMALRGHASIQGSTDIPTLFNLLPGYLPMPHAATHPTCEQWVDSIRTPGAKGFWAQRATPTRSACSRRTGATRATPENDFCFDYLPKLTGDHGTYRTVLDMIDGKVKGYFLLGQNPAVGSAHGRAQRLGMANLDWLVVRDLFEIESATFWKNSPEIETGEIVPGGVPHRGVPAAGRLARGEGGHVHPDPADAAVAGEGARPGRATAAPSCGSSTTSAG